MIKIWRIIRGLAIVFYIFYVMIIRYFVRVFIKGITRNQ